MTKEEIIEHTLKTVDFDRIFRNYNIVHRGDMMSIVFLALMDKDINWLQVRYNNNCLGKTISVIVRNLRNDENSVYYKQTRTHADIQCETVEDKIEYEIEKENMYGIYLDIIDEIFSEDEYMISMYKDYIVNNKTLRQISKEYNLNFKTIKKRFNNVIIYARHEFYVRLKNKLTTDDR